MQSQRFFTFQVLVFVALVATSGLLFAARQQVASLFGATDSMQTRFKGHRRAAGRAAVPVIVARVTLRRNDQVVSAIGTARAWRSLTLYPAVSGEIIRFPLKAGAKVKAGAEILRLDDRQAKLALRKAQAKRREAQRALARARKLHRKNIVAKSALEAAILAAETADIEYQQAKETLADHVLRAPFDGVAGIARVEEGARVTPSSEIMTLDDRSRIWVEFDVPERYLSQLVRGLPVTGHTPGFPGHRFAGHIDRIDSRVAAQSRSIRVRAVIENDKDELRPGMSFVITLPLPGRAFPAVPELALQWRKGQSYVWKVEDNKARKAVVRVVARRAAHILLDGPLTQGDLVVVEGVQRLRPGRAVKFTTPQPLPEPARQSVEVRQTPKTQKTP